uniref:Uncharacterized protein n=1 Tax=uncultured Desulfobacterium sp. TaxID=201089 RepID=E1YIL0_9BACT|nr:unknown protein [uncultured Desulfobacterium sp.]
MNACQIHNPGIVKLRESPGRAGSLPAINYIDSDMLLSVSDLKSCNTDLFVKKVLRFFGK